MTIKAYSHPCRDGHFWITALADGRWCATFDDVELGRFGSPLDAALAVASGDWPAWPASRRRPDAAKVSDDVSDWVEHPR